MWPFSLFPILSGYPSPEETPRQLKLPPAALDRVFALLCFNKREYGRCVLRRCALVNKEWAALSLKHRFYEVSLSIGDGFRPASKFLLSEEYGRVKLFIRKLNLCWSQAPGTIRLSFLDLLPHFPKLRSLALSGLLNERILWQDAPNARNCRVIKELTIIGRVYDSRRYHHDPSALCDLLSMFGPLERLTLENVNDNSRRNNGIKPPLWKGCPERPPEVASICLLGSYWAPLYDILTAPRTASSLRSLTLIGWSCDLSQSASRSPIDFIESLTALKELDIPLGAAAFRHCAEGPIFLDLTNHRRLRSLTLSSYAQRWHPKDWDPWEVLVDLLSNITDESALRSLTLNMTVQVERSEVPDILQITLDENMTQVENLEAELLRLVQGGRLKRIECRLLRFTKSSEPKHADFARALPLLEKTGVLVLP